MNKCLLIIIWTIWRKLCVKMIFQYSSIGDIITLRLQKRKKN